MNVACSTFMCGQNLLRGLVEDPAHKQLAYLTYDDLRQLPDFRGETLIAIKAPVGTTIEVPDPDQGMPPNQRRFQIWLKSQNGPVDVFLVSNQESERMESQKLKYSGLPTISPGLPQSWRPESNELDDLAAAAFAMTAATPQPGSTAARSSTLSKLQPAQSAESYLGDHFDDDDYDDDLDEAGEGDGDDGECSD
jgi:hypothetical protein